jgi:NTP pyrophosphatase (non-canonical NTP hydrolase)
LTTTYEAAVKAASNITAAGLRNQVINSLNTRGDFVGAVKAFHALYECPDVVDQGVTKHLYHMTDERLAMRVELIREEFERELVPAVERRDEVEIADALGDLVYVCAGFALEAGIDLTAVFAEIQASNMTKLGADGKVIRREDGKVMKGPQYVKPDIKAALRYRD